jgi:hypothetical protein
MLFLWVPLFLVISRGIFLIGFLVGVFLVGIGGLLMILGRIFFILGMVGFWELSRYLSSRGFEASAELSPLGRAFDLFAVPLVRLLLCSTQPRLAVLGLRGRL